MPGSGESTPCSRSRHRDGGGLARIGPPLLLAAVCGVLYFWRLGVTPLDDFDEAYYAGAAREMLQRGDLGTPYFNGRPFLLKPILTYWLIAGAFRLFGETEFAARVASAFLGTAVVLLTYWFGARTSGRRAGLLAGLALATCYLWIDLFREAMTDPPVTAALSGALYLMFLAAQPEQAGRGRLYLWASALLGIALLAKGIIPVAVGLLGFAVYLLGAGRLRACVTQARAFAGIGVALAVAGPWYAYEAFHHPEFLRVFFLGEHIGHIHGTLARGEPWWGHLKNVLVYFYPWSALLPAALVHAFRQSERGHVLRFAAWWGIVVVVAFSLARSKLAHYLAIGFPALALLVGAWLDAWLAGRSAKTRWAALGLTLIGVVGLVAAVAALVGPALLAHGKIAAAQRWPQGWSPGWPPVVILGVIAAGSLAALLGGLLGARGIVVPALAGAVVVAGVVHAGWLEPRIAQMQAQPRKELARLAARTLPGSEPLGVFYAKRNATVFYFGRPIVDLGEWDPAELTSFLSSPTAAAAITHVKYLPLVRDSVAGVRVVARRGDYVLVCNEGRPAAVR